MATQRFTRKSISPRAAWPALLLVACGSALAACTASVGDLGTGPGSGGSPAGGSGGSSGAVGGTGGTPQGSTGGATGSGSSGVPVTGSGGSGNTGVVGGTGAAVAPGGSGGAGTTGSGGTGGAAPVVTPAIPQTFRRLTVSQFRNSVRALLGEVATSPIEDDIRTGGLATTGATHVITSSDGVEKYQAAIDATLDVVFADATKRAALVSGTGCPPKVAANDACTRAFIEKFGRLAWRRPLTTAESTRYTTMAGTLSQSFADGYAGVRWALSALLQSPNFIYRVEMGQPIAGRADLRQLTSVEMASRLAYFLWDGPPDEALLTAATAGQLTAGDAIRTQAQRLLDAPKGRNAITAFVRDFFWLSRLDNTAKDAGLFPQFTPTLRSAMSQELTRMWEANAFEQTGSALDLFTTRRTFVNKELATLYGLPTTGLTDAVFTAVDLPATGARTGFLGTAALLSIHADQKEGSPTLRGMFVREHLLCRVIPPPPDDVDTTLPEPPAGVVLTKREKLDLHRSAASCIGCHQFMDPLGFPLETFDAVGKYRTTDAGKPIDASGELDGKSFIGLPGLAEALKASPAAASCLVKHLYQYASGSSGGQGEDVVVGQLQSTFASSGYRMKTLLAEIAAHEGFRTLTPATP